MRTLMAIVIVILFCVLLVVLHRLRFHPFASPERLRKALHILSGTTAFSFPWLFESPEPVWLLCGLILLLLVLRRGSEVTGGIERAGFGELFMPLAIAILFTVSRGQPPILYGLPLFYLVFADSFAALLGARFGTHPYGNKTLEGTATFAILALFASLAVLSPGPALIMAATALEHLSWWGADNLTVPLGSYLVLRELLSMPL
ncbi:hypothetical protein MK489_03630 [Myxococcota bacterium]|nr:hypothetical protein [Myxococcota bacterium]